MTAVLTTLEIVNLSNSRALKVTQLGEGGETVRAVVPPEGGRSEAVGRFDSPIGSEILVRDDSDGDLIQKITALPRKVHYRRDSDGLSGWFERVGDRHWRDADGLDWDALNLLHPGVAISARSDRRKITLPIKPDAKFDLADGIGATVTRVEGGTIRVEITVAQRPIGELRPTYKRLPNVDPVLSSFDPRGTFADNIKNGLKATVFVGLSDTSRNYSIADGDYIVQDGIAFHTINTLQGEAHSRVVTTTHEYMEAFNVGVKISAGAPTKSTESGGVTTSKAPVGGSLSVNYRESRGETRESTAGYTFAWEQTSHYRLSIDIDRLDLSPAFIAAVETAREDLGRPMPSLATFTAKIAQLQARLDRLMNQQRTKTGGKQQEIRSIRKEMRALESERSLAAQEILAGRFGAFIDTWGTHYAREVVFGQAKYETARFSQEELRKMHEIGVEVGLEGKGNIKGVDVGGQVDVGYTRRNEFSTLTRDDRIKRSEIGGGDFDSAEPIQIELRPLTELIAPKHFRESWRDDLTEFRDRLDEAIEALLGEPDLYPVLQGLEIWQVRFTSFLVIPCPPQPNAPYRQIHGGVKLNRSPQPLQSPDPGGLDAPQQTGKGYYIWSRSSAAGARVVHKTAEQYTWSGHSADALTIYLVAEDSSENPSVTLTPWIKDYARGDETVSGSPHAIDLNALRANCADQPNYEFWSNQIKFWVEARRLRFEQLPDYKRLEIVNALRTRDS